MGRDFSWQGQGYRCSRVWSPGIARVAFKKSRGGEEVLFGSAFVCLVDMFFVFKVGNEDLTIDMRRSILDTRCD